MKTLELPDISHQDREPGAEQKRPTKEPRTGAQRLYREKRRAAKAAADEAVLRFDPYQFFQPERGRREFNRLREEIADVETQKFQFIGRSTGIPHEKPAWMLAGRKLGEAYLRQRVEAIRPGLDKEETFKRWVWITGFYYVFGLAASDIADHMGITTDAVKGVIKRLS